MSPEEIEAWWAEAAAIAQPTPPVELEYRLYYNEVGDIVSCSMQDHTESGEYIVVEKPVYDTYFLYRIAAGKLVKIDIDNRYRVLLKRGSKGNCVVKNHAGLLLEDNETAEKTEYYEYQTN
jgi:hypothetical protein